jgi:hypothetical protein
MQRKARRLTLQWNYVARFGRDVPYCRLPGVRRADVTGVGAWVPSCRGFGIAKILASASSPASGSGAKPPCPKCSSVGQRVDSFDIKRQLHARQGCHPMDVGFSDLTMRWIRRGTFARHAKDTARFRPAGCSATMRLMLLFDGRWPKRALPVVGEYIRPNVYPRKSNSPSGTLQIRVFSSGDCHGQAPCCGCGSGRGRRG